MQFKTEDATKKKKKSCHHTVSSKCDPLSQNEYKVATAAFQNYYRFKFFIMQALK